MSEPGFQLVWLDDPRLAALALSSLPAWLWSSDGRRLLWANPSAAAIHQAPPADTQSSLPADPAAHMAQIAAITPLDSGPRLVRLQGLGPDVGNARTCNCTAIALDDNRRALLVVAAEPAGPDLPLVERVQGLLAGTQAPVAAFDSDGQLLHASPAALVRLDGAASLAALDANGLAAAARETGRAIGDTAHGRIIVERVESEAAAILFARFEAVEARSRAPALSDAIDDAPRPTQRRHPLRFVWQIDADGRFTMDSEDFLAIAGPRTTALLGRPWKEIAQALELDPDDQVVQAIATRETWSGLTVAWPVHGDPEPLTVELSGLPIYDRERTFQGYRGFGICRQVARLNLMAQARQATQVAVTMERVLQALPATARRAGQAAAVLNEAPRRENIVPLRAPPNEVRKPPMLTAIEHRAFRELSRRLSERLAAVGIAHDVAFELAEAESASSSGSDRFVSPVEAARGVYGPVVEPDSGPETSDVRPILDRLPAGLLIYRHNDLLYANEAFLRWTGYESLGALARDGGLDSLFIEPLGAADEHAGDQKLVLTAMAGRASVEGTIFPLVWEGEPAHALLTAGPAAPEAHDRAGTELAAARARIGELEGILDAITDAVVVLDREGRILSANRCAQTLFGFDAHAMTGRPLTDLLSPESAPAMLAELEQLLRRDGIETVDVGYEVVGRQQQGGVVPLSLTLRRLDAASQKLCALFRDATALTRSREEAREARRQAEEATAARSDFIAKVSHQIRTPLNTVAGFSEVMLEERFGPIGNERYRDYLRNIHASGAQILALINDLIDLSKIEAGKLDLSLTDVSLNELVHECVACVQPQANRERTIIRTSLSPRLPHVLADVSSLRRVVLDTLTHSIKWTGGGGQVIVSTALSETGEAVLRVRDTGAGLSENDIEASLQPFRPLAPSGRLASGVGLGLPFTKALAEANGATVQISSPSCSGTLIEIAFPNTRVVVR